MLNRFRRLMLEMKRGGSTRNSFEPWEIDVLLDLLGRKFKGRNQRMLLRRYERAVERQMESGPGPPMTFSEFLRRQDEQGRRVVPL